MYKKLEIYADEAWTQQDPLYRYHCFFGGIMAPPETIINLEKEIRELKKECRFRQEIKWTRSSPKTEEFFIKLINLFKDMMLDDSLNLKYRQLFLDRKISYKGEPETTLESQYKVYYQFIKHSFGLCHADEPIDITINLDTHSSHVHKSQLIAFADQLPRILNKENDLKLNIKFIDSRESLPLQLSDVLMGAAGYYGNNLYNLKRENQKRISKNQSAKKRIGKGVYDALRLIDNITRENKAFNWFETTGRDGDISNHFYHKLRIWKFEANGSIYKPEWSDKNFPGDKPPRVIFP